MKSANWIPRKMARWLPRAGDAGQGPVGPAEHVLEKAPADGGPNGAGAPSGHVHRSTTDRLSARLRRGQEALSPKVLRRTLTQLRGVVDARVSEVEGARRALAFASWYREASVEERHDAWLLMSEQFAPDARQVRLAREHYEAAAGTAEQGAAEIRLRRAMTSPRARLLQRFAGFPEGLRFLIDLRAEILPHLRAESRLAALDGELESLFSTWFDVGFLELRRISWDSPASLIEKLIRYEAVHDIRSWADVKNRLDADRRCYGFFHPRLPDEPLIFVEVAFTERIADSIAPLLDETAAASDPSRARTAIFYSISNTQIGLKGVSFGDSLIKRVVETLRVEFPRLRTFATLSPIPGLRTWLSRNPVPALGSLDPKALESLRQTLGLDSAEPRALAQALIGLKTGSEALEATLRVVLLDAAARYLGALGPDQRPIDPVARFHLGNGARVERLNWGADRSEKAWRQSFGLMVNYLYDLDRLGRYRDQLARGSVPMSREVRGRLD